MNITAGHSRLLLVANESDSIKGLARDLFLLDEQIETALRTTPSSALALLEMDNFDALAVDLELGPATIELLTSVATRFPRLARLVIADSPGDTVFPQAAHLAHSLLPRPCDAATIVNALQETLATIRRPRDPALTAAVAGILALPESPAMRRELLSLLADEEITLEQLEEAVKKNPAIAAKLLQTANSAYFGSRGSVDSIGEAVSMLGLDTVRGIVTAAHLFDAMPTASLADFPLNELWHHCVSTAVSVRRIAWHVRASANVNRAAFTAALLHDVGKIIMAIAHGSDHARLRAHPEFPQRPLWQEEERIFGHHHGTAGAMLLELWGLPSSVVEAVALHHTPHRLCDNTVTPLVLVHIANALVNSESPTHLVESHLDSGFLQRLLLPAKIDLWQTAMTADN